MLRFLRRGQRWVTALFVIGVGGVFVFFLGLGGPLQTGGSAEVVRVGDLRFDLRAFERARAERTQDYERALGDDFQPERFRDAIESATIQSLVDRAILALEAERLGLRVSKDEIAGAVLASQAFRDEEGRFDRVAFESWAEYEYGNQRNFIRDQRLRLLSRKMLRFLYEQGDVTEAEVREVARRGLQEVRFAFVVLDGDSGSEDVAVSEEEVQEAARTRGEELRAAYEEQEERFDVPEQVRARHILFRVPEDAPEDEVAAVRERVEAVREELEGGADFAALAKEHSEDASTREDGGDLGFFQRGQMVPAFEEAAFALPPGELSEPVRTPYGFHLIRQEAHIEAKQRAFEEVREQLARELLLEERSREAAERLAGELARAIRDGASLEEAARAAGLTLERTGWMQRRTDGFVPGLGAAPELLASAFVLPPGTSSPRIFRVKDRRALLQVLERSEPEAEEVEKVVEQRAGELREQRRQAQIQTWVEARRAELRESGDLSVNLEAIRG